MEISIFFREIRFGFRFGFEKCTKVFELTDSKMQTNTALQSLPIVVNSAGISVCPSQVRALIPVLYKRENDERKCSKRKVMEDPLMGAILTC